MSDLSWIERINAISVNPDMATRDDIARMAAEIQESVQAWYPASEPPKDSRHVLLAIEWTNYAGKRVRRQCMVLHLKQFEEEYCGDDDDFAEYEENNTIGYCPEGWYEFRNNEDDYLMVWENELTLLGWRDLPPMPDKRI